MGATKQKTRINVILCAIIFILTEFFGSRYIGPLSMRNIGLIVVFVFLLMNKWEYNRTYFKSFKYLIYYFVFVCLLGLINGFYEDIGATMIFARFLPTLLLFSLATFVLNSDEALSRFVYFLLAIMVVDAIATILQGVGNPIGWTLYSYFFSPESAPDTGVLESSIGHSFASGINGTVVGNGFYLSSFGLLFWFPYYKKRTVFSLLISISLAVLALVALFYNQQRMAFYVFVIFAFFILFFLLPSNGNGGMLLVVYALLGFILLSKINYIFSLDLGRLEYVSGSDVSERHIAHNIYYSDFFPNHFLTGDRHQYCIEYGYTPHNLIIETLLLGGILGLALFLLFIYSFSIRCMKDYVKGNREKILFAMPIFAILFVSWEHSSGFHTGMTMGAYLLALYEQSIAIRE